MLATRFTYTVTLRPDGNGGDLVVTRTADGAEKRFWMAYLRDTSGIEFFMSTMTDDLLDGYFPKPRKPKEQP
jgi:hypothetical protein